MPGDHGTIGTLVNEKYRIERPLGVGGMGSVYLATHVALSTQVALKMLHREGADAELRARFQREGVLAARLDSDHVVRVTDLGWADAESPYLVMELLEGSDLQGIVDDRGQLPVPEAVDLVLQAAAGVAAAHAAGLVHRDLKPANLFLARRKGRAPVVKVLDFGLSKPMRRDVLDSLTHETARFGTPVYMSPEQIRSAKHVDARADQYALAAVLYQCLAGRCPFESDVLTELFVLIATETPRPPSAFAPAVPRGLDAAVMRALSKDADLRFADVLGFAEAIAPFGDARAAERLGEVREALGSISRRGAELPPSSIQDEISGVPAVSGVTDDGSARSSEPLAARAARGPGSDDQARTLVRIPRTAQAHTVDSQIGLSTSTNLGAEGRARRFLVAGAVGALAVVGGWAVVRALVGADGATTVPSVESARGAAAPPEPQVAPGPVASAPSASAPAPEPSSVKDTPSAEANGAPSASESAKEPSRRAEKPPRKPVTPGKTGQHPRPGQKSVLDVFGER